MPNQGLTIDSFPTMEIFDSNAVIYVVSNDEDMKITAGELKDLLIENLPPPPMPEGVVSEQNFNSILEADQTFQQVEQKLTEVYHERLTANRIYYVRKDGSDTNAGLINDTSGAFLTIQKAINVASQIDFNENKNFSIIIQIGDGTYEENLFLNPLINAVGLSEKYLRAIAIIGNVGSPETVIIKPTNGPQAILSTGATSCYYLKGLVIDLINIDTWGCGITCENRSSLYTDSLKIILKPNTYGFWIHDTSKFKVFGDGDLIVEGNGYALISVATNSSIDFLPDKFILINNPTFSASLVEAVGASVCYFYANLIIGTAVGKRFKGGTNSAINTWGSGLNFIPGTIDGTLTGNATYS